MRSTHETLGDSLARLVEAYGPWTAHNLELAPGVFTLGPDAGDFHMVRAGYIAQLAQMVLRRPISEMRMLDLGSLEGGIAIGLAQLGANEVVGVEVRRAHLEKARFATDVLSLSDRVSFIEGDALKLDPSLGSFDLIVCAGLLYHFDAHDLLPFLRSLHRHCSGVLVLDTHVSQGSFEAYEVEGTTVTGRSYLEHPTESSGDKAARPWASWANKYAFWPTENGLANLVSLAGFPLVFRPLQPNLAWPWKDRDHWVAVAINLGAPHASNPLILRPDPDYRADNHPVMDDPSQQLIERIETKRIQ